MRKRRFFALICALLLLLIFAACKRDERTDPNADAGNIPPSAPESEGGNNSVSDLPFSVRFEYNGIGFDTAAGTLFTASTSTARSFTDDLAALRERMSECNAFEIGRTQGDLTYQTLSDGELPAGENTRYTISYTVDDNAGTIVIDAAAINAYQASNSHVSNISALVDTLSRLTELWSNAQS